MKKKYRTIDIEDQNYKKTGYVLVLPPQFGNWVTSSGLRFHTKSARTRDKWDNQSWSSFKGRSHVFSITCHGELRAASSSDFDRWALADQVFINIDEFPKNRAEFRNIINKLISMLADSKP